MANGYLELWELEEGMEFRNYKHLCMVVGWTIQKGNNNAKKKQFEELGRYFIYEKRGYKIILVKKREQVVAKVDKRTTKKETKLSHLIGKSIVDMLNHAQVPPTAGIWELSSFCISESDLKRELGLKNEDYDKYKRSKGELSEKLGKTLAQVEDFFTLTDDFIRDNMESAYKKLYNQRCAIIRKTKKLNFREEIADGGTIICHPSVYATENQFKFIFSVESAVLRKYNLRTVGQLRQKDELTVKRFYHDVIKTLNETAPSDNPELVCLKRLKSYSSAIEFSYSEDMVSHIIKKDGALTLEERDELGQSALNRFLQNVGAGTSLGIGTDSSVEDVTTETVKRLKTNAVRNHNRALKGLGKNVECRKSESYVEDFGTFAETLIERKSSIVA